MSKCKNGKKKPIYIVFDDEAYYPYVVIKTTVRAKAEAEYKQVGGDHVYLCTIIKEK
jgi:hypothetical protein